MYSFLRTFIVLGVLAFASACGATQSPTDPGGNNGGNPATGSLQLTVNGLDAGVDGALTVTGPAGFSQTVSASQTLTGVATGSYTVTAATVSSGATTYEPAQSSQAVTVAADQSTLVVVDYVAQLGGLDVQISGLPVGADPDVQVSGPGGFSDDLQAGTTLTGLPVGDYTVTATAVTSSSGDTYQPSPPTQTVSVPFNDAPVVTVDYSLAAASLAITINGLPGGVDAALEVTGPGGYSATVTANTTLGGLAPGNYTFDASAVVAGSTTYIPDTFTLTVTINGGDAEAVTVVYEELALLGNYERLSGGQDHTCGLDDSGVVHCWGTSNVGALGTGLDVDSKLTPVPVATGPYAQVEAGSTFTCARRASGSVDCWGFNFDGQIGAGLPTGGGAPNVLTPTPVAGGHVFTQISVAAESSHACGLDQTGSAWCWGRNLNGQLGDGTFDYADEPVAVAGGHTFTEIDVGGEYVCALKSNGELWCWGSNSVWQLGTSAVIQSNVPIQAAGSVTFATLGTGGGPCAMTVSGQVYCWGNTIVGGFTQQPTLSADGLAFVQLVKGVDGACGLTAAGEALCWGWNSNGQLGDGSTISSRATPGPVDGQHTFVELAAGPRNFCGVDTSGDRWCWGNNQYGQLGVGFEGDNVYLPTIVGSF